MQYDNYYHEAGHVVMASLFPEIFKIQFVTMNEAKSKANDALSLGGMRGQVLKGATQRGVLDYDALVFIMLGGLCADDMHMNGAVDEAFSKNEVWSAKFDSARYSGDVSFIGGALKGMFDNDLYRGSTDKYIEGAISVVYDIFSHDVIWRALELVRSELLAKEGNTLTGEEVLSLLDKDEIKGWKEANLPMIIKERADFFAKPATQHAGGDDASAATAEE